MSKHLETICVEKSPTIDAYDKTGSVSVPIYQTATFEHEGLGRSTGYDYSRLQNPTRRALEDVVNRLEHGVDCLALNSGMAALASIFGIFKSGDHIVAGIDLYGGTIRYFNTLAESYQIEFSYVDTTNLMAIEKAITNKTKAIFIETPTNPLCEVSDIKAISDIARKNNLISIVDNTFLTPYLQNPLDLGAKIVIHSGSKYLAGHNDTIAGFVITNDESISEKLRYNIKTIGMGLPPFDSWLVLRGIKTLALRVRQAESNAKALFEYLNKHPKIKKVYFTGDSTQSTYELSKTQARGFGSMISFETDTYETAKKVLESVEIIKFAESLGGVESLITYPITQTHADIPKDELASRGINDCFLRLSVGIEHHEDLIADLEKALGV